MPSLPLVLEPQHAISQGSQPTWKEMGEPSPPAGGMGHTAPLQAPAGTRGQPRNQERHPECVATSLAGQLCVFALEMRWPEHMWRTNKENS